MSLTAPNPPIVVDASITTGAVMGEGPASRVVASWQGRNLMLLAPPLLWSETTNALIRRHRLSAVEVLQALRAMEATGIEPADRGLDGVEAAIVLADRHSLSVYDAMYLSLAIDIDGELATLDADLARAAEAEGVALVLPRA